MRCCFALIFWFFLACSCQKKYFPVEDFSIFQEFSLEKNEEQIFLVKKAETWYLKTETGEELLSVSALNSFFLALQEIVLLEENTEFLCENPTLISFFSVKKELLLRYWFADLGEKTCFSYQGQGDKIRHYWATHQVSLQNFADHFSLDPDTWLEHELLNLQLSELREIDIFFPKQEENISIYQTADHFFELKNHQHQNINIKAENLWAYLAFLKKIQFLQKPSPTFLQDYEIDFSEKYGALNIFFQQKNLEQKINFQFFPLKKADGSKENYKCWGIFTQNGIEKNYIFSYFHIDLFLKTASFFENLN